MDDKGNIQRFDSDAMAMEAGFKARLSELQAEQLGRLQPHERAAWHRECQLRGELLPIPNEVEIARHRRELLASAGQARRVPGVGATVGGSFKRRR